MFCDNHVHCYLDGHAVGKMDEYVKVGDANDIAIMTFTAHTPCQSILMYGTRCPRGHYRMEISAWGKYLSEVNAVAKKIKDRNEKEEIFSKKGVQKVLCGTEAEFSVNFDEVREEYDRIKSANLDFVLGSLHHEKPSYQNHLKSKGLITGSPEGDRAIIDQYFQDLALSTHTGVFDCISHCDHIRIFDTLIVPNSYNPRNHSEPIHRFLEAVKQEDLAIEINTSGLRRGAAGLREQVHPDPLIIKWANEMNIPFTVGSDAHKPSDVGYGFRTRVREVLKENKITVLHYFEKKKRIEYLVALD